ncbi:hypothetical protein [Oricola thermophila]|uniref:H-NS histone family protein n=1 Tax=Oricola thermophila TaxID=2742145 RepID=A0A6N1VA77_9HYPH|nr:hypothetical protein [Oricola thermophila]QKV17874.1 hypothetical protein HTY61_05065 [Oricola thermophila]
MAERTVEQVEAEIARLQAEKLRLMESEITEKKKQAKEALLFLHDAGALPKALKEALTDKRGQIAIKKFFPERD